MIDSAHHDDNGASLEWNDDPFPDDDWNPPVVRVDENRDFWTARVVLSAFGFAGLIVIAGFVWGQVQ